MKEEDSTDQPANASTPRFSAEIEELLRRDTEGRIPPNKLRPFEVAHDVKWRQLLGKQIDPDLFQWVAKSVRLQEEIDRWRKEWIDGRITYDEMAERCTPLREDLSHGGIRVCMARALQSKDAEFFRAMAEIIEFIREHGIPESDKYGREPSEEGQFLQVWTYLENACPVVENFPAGCHIGEEFIELRHRFPSLDQLWKLGCYLYHWDKGLLRSLETNSEKMKERLRKFLTRRGLPYHKASR